MHLKDLKAKAPAELVAMAEELGVEAAGTMRRQDLMFCILRELADDEDYNESENVEDDPAVENQDEFQDVPETSQNEDVR